MPDSLRSLELVFNDAFATYKDMYYDEEALSSVYLWEVQDGFACSVLVKTAGKQMSCRMKGNWDSVHVVKAVRNADSGVWTYSVTTTIMLYLTSLDGGLDSMNLFGSLSRAATTEIRQEKDFDHVANVGRLIEDLENRMRGLLGEVYFGKCKDIVNELRSQVPMSSKASQRKQSTVSA